MAEIKWIKITTDMFDNRKIKHLRRLPDGNSIVLIWVMLLTMAGRCNAGGMIFLTENIPYTTKMLADELGFEENKVKLAIEALDNFNMVVTKNGCFTIAGWDEYQNIEGMERIREQNRIRQSKFKAKQKALPGNVTDNVTLTLGNATDIEEDKEIEVEVETYKTIVSYLNEKAGTNYRHTTAKTRTAIHARLAEGFTVDDFKTVVDKKCADWIGSEYEKYLRPETLFGTKFEGYLNAKQSERNDSNGQNPGNSASGRIGNYV